MDQAIIQNIADIIIQEAKNLEPDNLIRGIHQIHYLLNLKLLAVIKEEERKAEIAARLRKEVGGE